jgi:hypothetical protein
MLVAKLSGASGGNGSLGQALCRRELAAGWKPVFPFPVIAIGKTHAFSR